MTFVRTRLALDQMETGQLLLVRLKGADPLRQRAPRRRRSGPRPAGADRTGGRDLDCW